MFGDVGHGLLMTLAALWMVLEEKDPKLRNNNNEVLQRTKHTLTAQFKGWKNVARRSAKLFFIETEAKVLKHVFNLAPCKLKWIPLCAFPLCVWSRYGGWCLEAGTWFCWWDCSLSTRGPSTTSASAEASAPSTQRGTSAPCLRTTYGSEDISKLAKLQRDVASGSGSRPSHLCVISYSASVLEGSEYLSMDPVVSGVFTSPYPFGIDPVCPSNSSPLPSQLHCFSFTSSALSIYSFSCVIIRFGACPTTSWLSWTRTRWRCQS